MCLASHRAKRAKVNEISLVTNPNNQEVRHLTNARLALGWFSGIHEVWKEAMNHIDHSEIALQESPHCYALHPIHLFWGVEPHNQHVHYHHYLLLFNDIKNQPEHDLPALTTQEWHSVLGNTDWKKQWPKPNAGDPSTFNPNTFWKSRGALLSVFSRVLMSLQGVMTQEVNWQAIAMSN